MYKSQKYIILHVILPYCSISIFCEQSIMNVIMLENCIYFLVSKIYSRLFMTKSLLFYDQIVFSDGLHKHQAFDG